MMMCPVLVCDALLKQLWCCIIYLTTSGQREASRMATIIIDMEQAGKKGNGKWAVCVCWMKRKEKDTLLWRSEDTVWWAATEDCLIKCFNRRSRSTLLCINYNWTNWRCVREHLRAQINCPCKEVQSIVSAIAPTTDGANKCKHKDTRSISNPIMIHKHKH